MSTLGVNPRWGDVTDRWGEAWALELDNGCALNVIAIDGETGFEVELYNERGSMVERSDVRRDDPAAAMRVAEGMARDRGWL